LGSCMTFTEEEIKIIVSCLRAHLPLIYAGLPERVEKFLTSEEKPELPGMHKPA